MKCIVTLFLLCVLSSATPSTQTFPLKASANNRYLVDRNDVPFLAMGDSAQSIMANLSASAMSSYMADHRHHGFNSILVDALCTTYTGGNSNGTAHDGTAPFLTGSDPSSYDLSAPNNAYFAELDAFGKSFGNVQAGGLP